MTFQVDRNRLTAALATVRAQLVSERGNASHWAGQLSSSPLATATAISALVLAEQGGTSCGLPAYVPGGQTDQAGELYRGDLSELIVDSIHWLAEHQNDDGGWGDTDRSLSNIATTMLVQAAFHLTGVPAKYTDLLGRAEAYVAKQGGIVALKRRYEGDSTFAVPILTNCALADMVPWRKVASLPFELACLPQRWYNRLHLPVVSYAIPALVAIGQAKFHHYPPRNPLTRWVRAASRKRSLNVLEQIQPASGGYLEATPLTAFVVMSLASMGLVRHPVVRRGVEFLLSSVRGDCSWPIDTNLATWNTSQALTALDWQLASETQTTANAPSNEAEAALDWLLSCQHREPHPYTGAEPGGWAWTDLSGGVPDADDTPAALLALAAWSRRWPNARKAEVRRAASLGIHWLLELQNRDGGWPTFCRGWGKLPFDRSATDLTAHTLRALHVWRGLLQLKTSNPALAVRFDQAIARGRRYLEVHQQADGSWLPLWFGNQYHTSEQNPVYGTAKVLTMCHELDWGNTEMARRGARFLADVQHGSGGWGPVNVKPSKTAKKHDVDATCSVEETALALEALLPLAKLDETFSDTLGLGLGWLIEAIEGGLHLEAAPIGFYFAKLWYHERLYPQIFAMRTLQLACRASGAASLAISAVC